MRPTHRSFGTSIHLGIYRAIRPPGKVDRATISLAMAGGDPGNDAHVPLSNGAFMLSPDFAVAISWGVQEGAEPDIDADIASNSRASTD
jgi:hypothetical protein